MTPPQPDEILAASFYRIIGYFEPAKPGKCCSLIGGVMTPPYAQERTYLTSRTIQNDNFKEFRRKAVAPFIEIWYNGVCSMDIVGYTAQNRRRTT